MEALLGESKATGKVTLRDVNVSGPRLFHVVQDTLGHLASSRSCTSSVCLTCIYIPHACLLPTEPEEDRIGVKDGYKFPCGLWDLNSGPQLQLLRPLKAGPHPKIGSSITPGIEYRL